MLLPSPVDPVADLIGFEHLEFDRFNGTFYSVRGTPFKRSVPIGMPRIPPVYLNNVFYLYENEDDATAGRDFGGTGFFVAMPTLDPARVFVYAVTNWHVACQGGASVIRVNTHDGGSDIIPYGPEDWAFDPRYDIAVAPFNYNPELHKVSFVPLAGLALREHIENRKLGPGEDVFMVGRFIDHDGGTINRPAVRFGNISVMPSLIEQPNGKMADAYCIDLHSRSGYSGSPVFAYRTPGYDLEDVIDPNTEFSKRGVLLSGTNYLACIGIHFSQFIENWQLVNGQGLQKEISKVPLVREGAYVRGLSGMTCVLPAWTILEVLNMSVLQTARDNANAILEAEMTSSGNAVPDAEMAESVVSDSDENPAHREDFMRLVGLASKKNPPAPET